MMSKDKTQPFRFSDDEGVNAYVRMTCAGLFEHEIEVGEAKSLKMDSQVNLTIALNIAFSDAIERGYKGDAALIKACNTLRKQVGMEPSM